MAGYSITSLEDVPDVSGDYPGEIRMGTEHIGAEQVAFTWRRMVAGHRRQGQLRPPPPDPGGDCSSWSRARSSSSSRTR